MRMTKVIERVSYGLSGDIGGLPRQTYYTPDGRVIKALANMREYVTKDKDGKVISSGTRDANLDQGWLLTKPTKKKNYCRGCDRWHDTAKEVSVCILKQSKFLAVAEAKAKSEVIDKNAALEKKVAELEARINKLLEAKGG